MVIYWETHKRHLTISKTNWYLNRVVRLTTSHHKPINKKEIKNLGLEGVRDDSFFNLHILRSTYSFSFCTGDRTRTYNYHTPKICAYTYSATPVLRASRGIRTPESFRILITNQVQSATMRHWHFRRFVPSYNKSHQVPRQVWCWFYDDRLLSFATSLDVLLDFSCGYQPIDLFPHSKNTTKIYHIFQFSKS